MTKRRWLRILAIIPLVAILFALLAEVVLIHIAKSRDARYLRMVISLRMGATFDTVVDQLRNINISHDTVGDCGQECVMISLPIGVWFYKHHLVPPCGVVGELTFRQGRLAGRTIVMSRGPSIFVYVHEDEHSISRVVDRGLKIYVDVSPHDFTEFRNNAYDFNLNCIRWIKACRVDEYLPMNRLKSATAEK